MKDPLQAIRAHQQALKACTRCPDMQGPVVVGAPVCSPVLLVGQAPGDREIVQGRPFAWTAGRTLFRWFESIGLDEPGFRARVYMAAVCRCFPGKQPRGGDRVPSPAEAGNCAPWLEAEIRLLRPRLIIPVGKLAVGRFLQAGKLDQVIGQRSEAAIGGIRVDLIPLPHPSGASVWHRIEPGKTLLLRALDLIAAHPAWRQVLQLSPEGPRTADE